MPVSKNLRNILYYNDKNKNDGGAKYLHIVKRYTTFVKNFNNDKAIMERLYILAS